MKRLSAAPAQSTHVLVGVTHTPRPHLWRKNVGRDQRSMWDRRGGGTPGPKAKARRQVRRCLNQQTFDIVASAPSPQSCATDSMRQPYLDDRHRAVQGGQDVLVSKDLGHRGFVPHQRHKQGGWVAYRGRVRVAVWVGRGGQKQVLCSTTSHRCCLPSAFAAAGRRWKNCNAAAPAPVPPHLPSLSHTPSPMV